MGFEIRREDKDIVHVCDHPFFVDLILENMVHVRLKGGRGIAEAEKHDDRFIETGSGDECCLPAIVRMDKDVVVSPSDIDLSEVLGRAEFVEKWGN